MTDTVESVARIQVFLLEDHEAVRRSVAERLGEEPDLQVVGEAATAAQALDKAPLMAPDVAVLDVRLPDGDGVTVCRELRSRLPQLHCLMLTSLAEEDALLAAVLAGASGYRLKQVRGTDLAGAVRAAARGQSLLDADTVAGALRRMRSIALADDPAAGLSEPEHTMLELIGAGLTNPEIGERMTLAEAVVRDSVRLLLDRLGVQRITARPPAGCAGRTECTGPTGSAGPGQRA
jgi:DNA-binding NarL/FixJ family response regulator